MIGLTLVALISTFGQSVKASLAAYVHRSLGSDFVVHTDNFDRFSPVVATRLRARPELTDIAAFRFGTARIAGKKADVQGVESGPLVESLKVKTLQGDIASIDRGELAISQNVARDRHLKLGQKVPVIWPRTGDKPMTIGAVYATNLFAGDYLVGGRVVDDNVTQKLVGVVAASLKPGVSPASGRKAVDTALKDFPNLDVDDASQLISRQKKQLDQLLNVMTAMLMLSVLIALLGILNTLALSVVERTRELGLLRAVGLSRRQLRRMIRVESVLIGLYGAVLGAVIGVALGAALVHALRDQGIDTFALPVTRLVLVLVAGGVAGVIAAALPARRAARLNVLAAIAEE
jgi:putative ABC transport system permease protein